MAKKLDPKIAEILKDHGYGTDAAWDCHGTWVVYHRVLEQIAAKARIAFEPPIVLEANSPAKCAAICVIGRMGDQREWSIGEAAPGNNKNAYPYAMAEKRAKDRVVLKLIGLHGLAYSEDEADDFKPATSEPAQQPQQTNGKTPDPSPLYLELHGLLSSIVTHAALLEWAERVRHGYEAGHITSDERLKLKDLYKAREAHIAQQAEADHSPNLLAAG